MNYSIIGSQAEDVPSPDDRFRCSDRAAPSISLSGAQHQQQPLSALRTNWTICLLPILSLSYLIFCFVVDYKTVQVSIWNVEEPVARINIIKAGVTSINILIISLAIFPVKSLVGDIQAEEFFRVLTLKKDGVPLSVLNKISLPSYGFSHKFRTVIHREGSNVFASAFAAGVMAIVVSALAPATLSVQVVQIDDELQAFRVGAVFRGSVWNSTYEVFYTANGIRDRAEYAAGLPWVEHILGATYKWELPEDGEDGSMYAIPNALDVPITRPVRYATDIIRIKPACKWHAPEFRDETSIYKNITTVSTYALIPELGWTVYMGGMSGSPDISFKMISISPGSSFVNDARGNAPIDGSVVWHLFKCIPGGIGECPDESMSASRPRANLVITDVPSTRYVSSKDNATYAVSYLVCHPNEFVETREISTDLNGKLTLGSSSSTMTRQYNIDTQQARILMSHSLLGFEISKYSGPNPHEAIGMWVGGAAHLQLLFGTEVAVKAPEDLKFVVKPIHDISRSYGKIFQSSLKMFLDGTIGYGYVPGRTLRSVVIFTTSRPHLYVSTIVFVILLGFMVAAHFRSRIPQFTFVDVASSLSQSDVPGILEGIKSRNGEQALRAMDDEELRDSSIILEGQPDVSPTTIRFR